MAIVRLARMCDSRTYAVYIVMIVASGGRFGGSISSEVALLVSIVEVVTPSFERSVLMVILRCDRSGERRTPGAETMKSSAPSKHDMSRAEENAPQPPALIFFNGVTSCLRELCFVRFVKELLSRGRSANLINF